MDIELIRRIRPELESVLAGNRFGKVFSFSRHEFVIDFRLPDSQYLFVSVEPVSPRIYLIRRRVRDLEKLSGNLSSFVIALKKRLSGAMLRSIVQAESERVLNLAFNGVDDFGNALEYSFAVQLTGRSSNLFLLDSNQRIVDALRETKGEGQQVGDVYSPPSRAKAPSQTYEIRKRFPVIDGKPLSELLDAFYLEKNAKFRFQELAKAARDKLRLEKSKREKLARKLNDDLAAHGDAEKWKRFGDLLLANVANAKRIGSSIRVIDYFDDNVPEIDIPVDLNVAITEAAKKFFKRYAKARNASVEIEKRLGTLVTELDDLNRKIERLEDAIAERNEDFVREAASSGQKKVGEKSREKKEISTSGSRSFISTDGFEILVGKKAKDNDFLTFRIAKSLDTWMHAADYPGSHVVIRNPNRKEIPQRTLIEAAQIAAFYSQGKAQPKAAVHYTLKKFVNKPRGAAPGLVSLASFKTLLVEPKIDLPTK
ncbi:MAG: Rqc2 family fibronectin-binding protein [Blastocatellia bacterium]